MPWEPSTDEPLNCVFIPYPRQPSARCPSSYILILLLSTEAALIGLGGEGLFLYYTALYCIADRGYNRYSLFPPCPEASLITLGWRRGCVRLQDTSRVCSPLAATLSQGYLPATPLVTRVSRLNRKCWVGYRAWLYSTFTLVVVELSQYQFRCVKCVSLHT